MSSAHRCLTPSTEHRRASAGDRHALRSNRDLPSGRALVDVDKLTHAVPQEEGTRLFLGAQHLHVPHSLHELEKVLAGRERTDDAEGRRAGFGVG